MAGLWGSIATLLGLVARLAESIDRLPGVPTADWCQCAAEAYEAVLREARVVVGVSLHEVQEDGRAGSTWMRGLAGPSGDSPISELARLLSGTPHDNAKELVSGVREISGMEPAIGSAMVGTTLRVHVLVAPLGLVPREPLAQVVEASLEGLRARATLAFDQRTRAQVLTTRQSEVLRFLMAGRSPKEIALATDRSHHTISDSIKGISAKLGTSGQLEIVAAALAHERISEGIAKEQGWRRSPPPLPRL